MILIFVVLNILFVMTGLLPLLMRRDPQGRVGTPTPVRSVACLAWSDASMAACAAPRRARGQGDRD